jgi:hypothetical protein
MILRPKCRVKRHICRTVPIVAMKLIACPAPGLASARSTYARAPDRLFNRRSSKRPRLQGQTPIRRRFISRSVSYASSQQAEGSADFSSRPLPWLVARLEDAPYCCEPQSLVVPHPPSPARPLRGLNVVARLERCFQGKLRLVSCRSSLIRMCNKRRPLNPRIERAAQPFQYIREMAQTGQASDRFSALTLPRILSVLTS